MVLTKFQNLNLCGSVLWTLIGTILCRFPTYGTGGELEAKVTVKAKEIKKLKKETQLYS